MATERVVEENVMKTTTSPGFSRSTRRRGARLAGSLAAACVFLLASSAVALGDVRWQISSVHGPQSMAPASTGQYVIQAFNVGDADTTDPYTITDTLPAGVLVTAASGAGWDCSGTTLGTGTIQCIGSDTVFAPGPQPNRRGAAAELVITVAVPAGAAGTVDNTATISGGSGTASPASATDPTPFSSTSAGFGFVPGSLLADLFDAQLPGGSPVRLAGSHPSEMRVSFESNLKLSSDPTAAGRPYTEPDDHVRNLETKLPIGLIGNPQAVPQCDPILFDDPGPGNYGACPANTQVGSANLVLQDGTHLFDLNSTTDVPVFNMVPTPGAVAQFAFSLIGNPAVITVSLDSSDHYAVVATVTDTTELLWLRSADLTLWGVPADPAHDALRFDPNAGVFGSAFTGAPIRPFLTMPSQCDQAGMVQIRADSWQHPGVFTPWQTGASAQMTGCDDPRFRFEPSIAVQPQTRTPSTPTGLNVDISVPQKNDTVSDATQLYPGSGSDAAIATPPLRNASVTLPQGMSVSPSSADGLLACSSMQIGLGTNDEPTCPDASKIGTVSITTPLLPDPLTGNVYFAAQSDNPFGSLLALYIVARGPGVIVKLPGQVTPDPITGQLTATFDDNPQVPFSNLHLQFKGGPRAPLVTPPTCGVYTTSATFTSWVGSLPAAPASDSFTISGDGNGAPCAARGFDPSFVAGTTNPVAGKDSPLVTRFSRGDQDQELGSIAVSLPPGLLGRIASAVLCPDGPANAGACGDGSRIGTATVAAGPGSDPFYITDGRVYVTGPYKGAPFGLSIVVHAKAGPLDLGNVVVRAQIQVNRATAALTVVTDPLPTILAGIPLQLRVADVTVDRPRFTFNPTNCSVMSSTARLTSTEGTVATKSSRFAVADCAALPFSPRLSIRVGARHHTQSRVSTPLTATVTVPKGDANLRSVSVTLPTTLNALLPVVNRACTLAAFRAGHCTSKARVGSVVAITPLLRDPLRGSAYFVKNPARVIPDLMLALRGQIDLDVTGKVKIPGGKALSTRFDTIPDAPITMFRLSLVSGANGPLGTAASLCTAKSRAAKASIGFRAQSGKLVQVRQRLHIDGCPKPKKK
jgi:hypothetical protein